MQVHDHYGEALAVDANGQLLSRYENGIWKVIPPSDFARDVAGLFSVCVPRSRREDRRGGDPETDYSRQDAPARRLIGFRNGVLDTSTGIFSPHRQIVLVAYAVRCRLYTHRWKRWRHTRQTSTGAGSTGQPAVMPARRDSQCACFMVLANRYDWRRSFSVTGPGGGRGKVFSPKLRPCSLGGWRCCDMRHAGRPPQTCGPDWLLTLIRLPDPGNGRRRCRA